MIGCEFPLRSKTRGAKERPPLRIGGANVRDAFNDVKVSARPRLPHYPELVDHARSAETAAARRSLQIKTLTLLFNSAVLGALFRGFRA